MEGTKEERKKVLVIGDAVVTTGFARVLHSIFSNLVDKYEIHHLGVNYRGDPHDFNYKIYPAVIGGDLYGLKRIGPLIDNIKPDIIFILNDIWVHYHYMEELDKLDKKIPIVLYFPIDAAPIESKWVKACKNASRLIVYTNFAKKVLEDSVKRILEQDPEFVAPKVEIIPHGIDTERFHPFSDDAGVPGREIAKRRLYPDQENFINSFIVLNANRNQPRKRIDTTMKGFQLFSKDKPLSVKLYLHMGVEDVGWNIIDLAHRYGIDHRLIISSTVNTIPGVSDERLNLIYNATDVGINTSVGEGWGLTNWEHAATRAAQLVPKHSACAELWEGKAVLMEPAMYLTNERVLTEGGIVTPEAVANGLQLLYDDVQLREHLANVAFDFIMGDEFKWNKIAEKVDKVLQEVLSE